MREGGRERGEGRGEGEEEGEREQEKARERGQGREEFSRFLVGRRAHGAANRLIAMRGRLCPPLLLLVLVHKGRENVVAVPVTKCSQIRPQR